MLFSSSETFLNASGAAVLRECQMLELGFNMRLSEVQMFFNQCYLLMHANQASKPCFALFWKIPVGTADICIISIPSFLRDDMGE